MWTKGWVINFVSKLDYLPGEIMMTSIETNAPEWENCFLHLLQNDPMPELWQIRKALLFAGEPSPCFSSQNFSFCHSASLQISRVSCYNSIKTINCLNGLNYLKCFMQTSQCWSTWDHIPNMRFEQEWWGNYARSPKWGLHHDHWTTIWRITCR